MSGFSSRHVTERQVLVLRPHADLSLASPDAVPFIDAMVTALLAPQQPYVAVVVIKREESEEARLGLAQRLASEVLYEGLFVQLARLRRLCQDLAAAPRPWVFVGQGSAFDAWFSLAASCTYGFFTQGEAMVGFRDAALGLLPPLGVFEQWLARKDPTGHDWAAQPLMRARDAVLRGGVTAIVESLDGDVTDEDVAAFVAQHLEKRRRRESGRVRMPKPVNQLPPPAQLTRPLPSPPEAAAARGLVEGLRVGGQSVDKLWGALREKEALLPKDRKGQAVLAFAAKAMLTPAYQAGLQAMALRGGGEPSRDWYGEKVYVDVDHLVPPERVLERLYQQKMDVVFHAKTADGLVKAMTLLEARFERSFSQRQAAHYWDRFSFWAVLPAPPRAGIALQWHRDDAVTATLGKAVVRVISLEGNKGVARPGWVEWLGPAPEGDEAMLLRSLLASVYLGIWDPLPALGMPVSVYLRTWAIEALARAAQPDAFNVQQIIEALGNQGWRFLGNPDGVDRFLASRNFMPWDVRSAGAHDPLTEDVTRAHSLRALKVAKTKAPPGQVPLARNPVLVSEHFALLAFALVHGIMRKAWAKDHATAERWVSESLGFPGHLGTPLAFAQTKGIPRAVRYAQAYWPSFMGSPAP